jgi:hypothetical protein
VKPVHTSIIEFEWTAWEADALGRLAYHGPARGRALRSQLLRANRLALERAAMAAERDPDEPQGPTARMGDGADGALDELELSMADVEEARGPAAGELFAMVRRHGDARFCRAIEVITQWAGENSHGDIVIASFFREIREYLLWRATAQPQLLPMDDVEHGNGWIRAVFRLGTRAVTCWLTGGALPNNTKVGVGLVLHYEIPNRVTAFGRRLGWLGSVGDEHVFIVPEGGAAENLERYLGWDPPEDAENGA